MAAATGASRFGSAPDMTLDEDTRVRLSAQPGTEAAVLHELAVDTSVTVRATLAMNPAVSADTNALLARDSDERVRALLARKLASLAPALSDGARTRLQRETLDTLTRLAEDEAVRACCRRRSKVKCKDLPDVPRDLILRLARDEATSVYEPVIRFSPMLTTDDLVALVASAQSSGARLAVARRSEIVPDVSDALISDGTEDVILALLMNQSAHIREATLDALAERSAAHPAWHSPLVQRPALSSNAVRTLSRFVADHLLQISWPPGSDSRPGRGRRGSGPCVRAPAKAKPSKRHRPLRPAKRRKRSCWRRRRKATCGEPPFCSGECRQSVVAERSSARAATLRMARRDWSASTWKRAGSYDEIRLRDAGPAGAAIARRGAEAPGPGDSFPLRSRKCSGRSIFWSAPSPLTRSLGGSYQQVEILTCRPH